MTTTRITLALLLCLITGAVGAASRPMAVLFYADWCMNCKMIAPKLAKVQPEFEQQINFVKLDVTNAERKVATRDKAKELGILPLYMSNKATGWLALIDSNGKQVGDLRHTMSEDEIRAALARLAGPAPAEAASPASAAPQP